MSTSKTEAELLHHDDDDKARLYTVYGYERDPECPELSSEPFVSRRWVNPSTPWRALEVHAKAVEERPDLNWHIEWRLAR